MFSIRKCRLGRAGAVLRRKRFAGTAQLLGEIELIQGLESSMAAAAQRRKPTSSSELTEAASPAVAAAAAAAAAAASAAAGEGGTMAARISWPCAESQSATCFEQRGQGQKEALVH